MLDIRTQPESIVSQNKHTSDAIRLDGYSLELSDVEDIKFREAKVAICQRLTRERAFEKSCNLLKEQLDSGRIIYGVNTLFGGLANQEAIDPMDLQRELLLSHMAGAGDALEDQDVKLALILRANSLCHGVSAIRENIVDRYLQLANRNILPLVQQYGSIGASGDLIPLSAIAGAVTGQSGDFKLKVEGNYHPAPEILEKLGLPAIALKPKEGLALINGTSVLTAIAANNCLKMSYLFNLHMILQVAVAEILNCDMRPFSEFIQRHRPHPGQKWVAARLRDMLASSTMVRDINQVEHDFAEDDLIQDRYSVRCMPQFLGAIVEELTGINRTVTVEMNSATDNPLIDVQAGEFLHGGNFLGQHVAMSMDKMRISIALLAKHNEAQIATLVEPAFSRGLSASLVADTDIGQSVGVKPLQILSNSLTPLLEQNANPLTTHFPVHGEQFNQNINSQGFGSAQLTRKSLDIYTKQTACMSLIVCHAMQLKAAQFDKPVTELFSVSSCQLLAGLTKLTNEHDKEKGFIIGKASSGKFSEWLEQIANGVEDRTLGNFEDIFDVGTTL